MKEAGVAARLECKKSAQGTRDLVIVSKLNGSPCLGVGWLGGQLGEEEGRLLWRGERRETLSRPVTGGNYAPSELQLLLLYKRRWSSKSSPAEDHPQTAPAH